MDWLLTKSADNVKQVSSRRTALTAACFLFLFSSLCSAGTLRGKVIGSDGDPRPYMRLTFLGPQKVTAISDARGQFLVNAPGGKYQVRIVGQNRSLEAYVEIPFGNEMSTHNFSLTW